MISRRLARCFYPYDRTVLSDLSKEMQALRRTMTREGFHEQSGVAQRSMPVDYKETQDKVEIVAELPGMNRDQVQVEVHDGNILTLKGEFVTENKKTDEKAKYHYSERTSGKFARAFQLPDNIRLDAIQAQMKDGLLKLSIPKFEPKPTKTTVKIQVDNSN